MQDVGVDAATFQGFLETARRELDLMTGELEQAVGGEEREQAARIARTLGSVCTSVGAHRAAARARELAVACGMDKGVRTAHAAFVRERDHLVMLMDQRFGRSS
ncbi:hypothetical protein [Pseudodesulfovibrio tunisiensis]|uniref:hypothetical protein n=1 Tax=Pseudodesulfovibrio tunisiensis TaxID=463192 RepID=UPI001FB4160C|nr:hypothetical protein [Pseudodesulfovibrio tunisiensis]